MYCRILGRTLEEIGIYQVRAKEHDGVKESGGKVARDRIITSTSIPQDTWSPQYSNCSLQAETFKFRTGKLARASASCDGVGKPDIQPRFAHNFSPPFLLSRPLLRDFDQRSTASCLHKANIKSSKLLSEKCERARVR